MVGRVAQILHPKSMVKKALTKNFEFIANPLCKLAALERKCPRYWRLHSLINNTVVIQPSDSHDSKKQESRETSIVKNIPTDTLDKEIFVNSDENSLHSSTVYPLSYQFVELKLTSD